MQQPDHHAGQGRAERLVGRGGVGQVQRFAFLDQRADPVDLPPLRHLRADAFGHLVAPAVGDQLGDDRRAAGRQFVDRRDVQVGVVAHGQRARDRRGRHHQQVRLLAGLLHLVAQRQPLRHAEPVLLVDDGQPQVPELHLLLDDRMRADDQCRLAAGRPAPAFRRVLLLLAAGQPGHAQAARREQRLQPADQLAEVLLGQDFGRRHQRALPAGVDGDRRRQRRDHGLARADIALQQPVHRHAAAPGRGRSPRPRAAAPR